MEKARGVLLKNIRLFTGEKVRKKRKEEIKIHYTETIRKMS